jgi:hypothetical protein
MGRYRGGLAEAKALAEDVGADQGRCALQIEWPYRLVQFLGSTSLQGVQPQDVSCARIATGRVDRNQLATGAELQNGIGIGRTKSPTLASLLKIVFALGPKLSASSRC